MLKHSIFLLIVTLACSCDGGIDTEVELDVGSLTLPGPWSPIERDTDGSIQFVRSDERAQITIRTYGTRESLTDDGVMDLLEQTNAHYRQADVSMSPDVVIGQNRFGHSDQVFTIAYSGTEASRSFENFAFGTLDYVLVLYIETIGMEKEETYGLAQSIVNSVSLARF